MDNNFNWIAFWISFITVLTLFNAAMLILTQQRIELLHDRMDYVEKLIDTQKNEVVPDYQSLIQLHQ